MYLLIAPNNSDCIASLAPSHSFPANRSRTIHPAIHAVIHMSIPITLASGSQVRARLLRDAGLDFDVVLPHVDEESVKASLVSEGVSSRDVADVLAEAKARKVSAKQPGLVIGCDQVLDFEGKLISKPETPTNAISHLTAMRAKRHTLLSAAVVYEDGNPVWRHVGQVRLLMRDASDAYLADYVARNWDSIQNAVGAYKLEEEGVRLFTRVDGDYFNVLGIPLLELLSYLTLKGVLPK